MAIPEFLDMVECPTAVRRILEESERAQVNALMRFRMNLVCGHATLVDDPTSYVEAECNMQFCIRYPACS